jgi:hypothetical protein
MPHSACMIVHGPRNDSALVAMLGLLGLGASRHRARTGSRTRRDRWGLGHVERVGRGISQAGAGRRTPTIDAWLPMTTGVVPARTSSRCGAASPRQPATCVVRRATATSSGSGRRSPSSTAPRRPRASRGQQRHRRPRAAEAAAAAESQKQARRRLAPAMQRTAAGEVGPRRCPDWRSTRYGGCIAD